MVIALSECEQLIMYPCRLWGIDPDMGGYSNSIHVFSVLEFNHSIVFIITTQLKLYVI